MKSRIELSNIACMTSLEVTGVLCVFEKPSAQTPRPKPYLYKVPRVLADTLKPGDLVLAEYEGQQASQRDRPLVPVIVASVLQDFDPETMELPHKWVFAKAPMAQLEELQLWEKQVVDTLHGRQRRRAREAVTREILGEDTSTLALPSLAGSVEEATVIEDSNEKA